MDDKPARREKAERKTYLPDAHRLLPQAPDAEKGILSSMLIAPRNVIPWLQERGVTTEWFAIPSHAEIFRALCEMSDLPAELDFISLSQYLRDRNRLDSCGGAAFVTELFTFLPTAANAPYYVDVLDEKRQLRQCIQVMTPIIGRCYDEQANVDGLMDEMEAQALKIRQTRFGKVQSKTTKQLVVHSIGYIEDLYTRRGQPMGLTTGFAELDSRTNGLTGNRMIVIAARPSVGKTSLAMNIAEHLALAHHDGRPKVGVLVFSLEMSAEQLMLRMLCSRARVNLQRVQDGFLSERDFPNLQMAASKLADCSNLIIDDFSEATIQYARAKARRYRQEFRQRGIEHMVIIGDYLQLFQSSNGKRSNNSFDRQVEVSEISRNWKLMCKELYCAGIVLSQMNRKIEEDNKGRATRTPKLSDLRESGSLEQDADDVWFLTRDEMDSRLDDEGRDEVRGRATLNIAKQRNGEAGPGTNVKLTFLREYTRFETRATEQEATLL